MMKDISGRGRQPHQPLPADEASRIMVDGSPVPCMMNLLGAHITSVNDRFVELTGYPAHATGRTHGGVTGL